MKSKTWYVYRHTKPGTPEVFYIGIGSTKNFARAYNKTQRNYRWLLVFKSCGVEVEILTQGLTKENAIELEVLLIDYYKRADCCNGSLVNLTDGGEGTAGKTPEQIEKWRKANLGKQDGERNIMFGRTRGKHHRAKLIINLETGIFYDSALDALENLQIAYSTFKAKLQGKLYNDTGHMYADDYERGLLPREKIIDVRSKKVINVNTLEVFDSIKSAAENCGKHSGTFSSQLTGRVSNKSGYQLLSDYEKCVKPAEYRGNKKYVLDLNTGVFYYSGAEAAYYNNIDRIVLKNMLNLSAPNKNNTSLIYV